MGSNPKCTKITIEDHLACDQTKGYKGFMKKKANRNTKVMTVNLSIAFSQAKTCRTFLVQLDLTISNQCVKRTMKSIFTFI
jgi:hypothetical protein